jgi:hypothetical protein
LLPGFSAAFLMFRPRFFNAVICKEQHRKVKLYVALHALLVPIMSGWLDHASHMHSTFSHSCISITACHASEKAVSCLAAVLL